MGGPRAGVRAWGHTLVLGTIGGIVVLYIVINLAARYVVGIVHIVHLSVHVVDVRSGKPIDGAKVEAALPIQGRFLNEGVRTTGKDGVVVLSLQVPQQPEWLFPIVGTIHARHVVRMRLPNGEWTDYRSVPDVPMCYGECSARMRIDVVQ